MDMVGHQVAGCARHSKVRVVWQTPPQQTLNTGDSTQAVTTEEVFEF